MYLIDESYFNGIISIPNLNETRDEAFNELEYYVNDKVRLFLESVLGNKQFKELDGFIINGKLKDDAPEKWKDLVYGCNYEVNGIEYTFRGLLEDNSYLKKSLLAYFVFWNWHTDNITQVVGTGEIALQGKNAVNVNSSPRLTRVWNDFVYMYQGYNAHIPNKYYHCGVKVVDYIGSNDSKYTSMRAFLDHKSETYKGFNRVSFDIKNQFGLI